MATQTSQQDQSISWTDDEQLYIIAEINIRKLRRGQAMFAQLAAIMRRLLRCGSMVDSAAKSDKIAECGGQLKKVLFKFARAVRRAGEARKARRIRKDARRAGAVARAQGGSLMELMGGLVLQ